MGRWKVVILNILIVFVVSAGVIVIMEQGRSESTEEKYVRLKGDIEKFIISVYDARSEEDIKLGKSIIKKYMDEEVYKRIDKDIVSFIDIEDVNLKDLRVICINKENSWGSGVEKSRDICYAIFYLEKGDRRQLNMLEFEFEDELGIKGNIIKYSVHRGYLEEKR